MESYSQQELLQLEIRAPSPDPFTESCSDTDWHNRFIVTDEQTAAQWQSHYCCDVTGKQWGNYNDNSCSLNGVSSWIWQEINGSIIVSSFRIIWVFPILNLKLDWNFLSVLELTTYWFSARSHSHYTKKPTVSGRHRKTFSNLQSCMTGSSWNQPILLIQLNQYKIGKTQVMWLGTGRQR